MEIREFFFKIKRGYDIRKRGTKFREKKREQRIAWQNNRANKLGVDSPSEYDKCDSEGYMLAADKDSIMKADENNNKLKEYLIDSSSISDEVSDIWQKNNGDSNNHLIDHQKSHHFTNFMNYKH